MTVKKRGRPVGSKNRPKPIKQANVRTFEQNLEWDELENRVDLKDFCEKLQDALAKAYVDFENLEKNIAIYQKEILRRDVIIQYLESKTV